MACELGAVGGRIVGEVFIGLLQADPEAFINAKPGFKPTLPTKTGKAEDFRVIALPHLRRGGSRQPWPVATKKGREFIFHERKVRVEEGAVTLLRTA